MAIVGIFAFGQGIPTLNAAILAFIVIALTVLAIVFISRGVPISTIAQGRSDTHSGQVEEAPDELPIDLVLPNEIYNHVAPALQALGFSTRQNVDSTRWAKTYRYSEAERQNYRIIMIKLDPQFFAFGTEWFQKRWLAFAVSIFRTPPNQLVIFSDTRTICQEAHYEIDDVRKNLNVDTIFLTKMILDTIRASDLNDNVENLKLHLKLV